MADSTAAAERQGVGLSSSAQGGQGSIVSQLDSSLSFLDQYNRMSDQASEALGRAVQYRANAESFGTVENASLQGLGHAGQITAGVHKIFGGS